MDQVWNALLPVLGFIIAGCAVCFLLRKRNRGKRGPLRVDPVSNLFVDREDRQDDLGDGAL